MGSIAIIGAGKWGRALHFALSEKNFVKITARKEIELDGFCTLDEALNCKFIIFALPAQVYREWLRQNFTFKNQNILVASKGIESSTGALLNEIFLEFIPQNNLAFLSGPSFAKEVLKSLPTAIIINSTNKSLSMQFASFFPNFIKTYTSDDVVGAEICGAYKNILAIAAGICDGLELGNNAKASMIARGLVEMKRFGLHFGAKEETFLGLSGAGDLFLSANSSLSRNYRVGYFLAKGESLNEALEQLGEVAEGVETSKAVYMLSKKNSIYTPIASEVKKILEGKDPKDSLKDLLRR